MYLKVKVPSHPFYQKYFLASREERLKSVILDYFKLPLYNLQTRKTLHQPNIPYSHQAKDARLVPKASPKEPRQRRPFQNVRLQMAVMGRRKMLLDAVLVWKWVGDESTALDSCAGESILK